MQFLNGRVAISKSGKIARIKKVKFSASPIQFTLVRKGKRCIIGKADLLYFQKRKGKTDYELWREIHLADMSRLMKNPVGNWVMGHHQGTWILKDGSRQRVEAALAD